MIIAARSSLRCVSYGQDMGERVISREVRKVTGPAASGKRLGIPISAALLALLSVTEPVSASVTVSSSFPTGLGFNAFGFDPAGATFDLHPGLAYEFRTHSLSAPLESRRLSLNQLAGENEMEISLREAAPYVDGAGVSTIRPGQIIESFHFQDVLGAATQIVTVESVLQPLLQQNTSYFISVAAIDNGQRQLIRWSVGDGYGLLIDDIGDGSDIGLVRAFLSDTGWGTYLYAGYPRGAFEVIAVPEPGAGALCATGLILLAYRSRRLVMSGAGIP